MSPVDVVIFPTAEVISPTTARFPELSTEDDVAVIVGASWLSNDSQ
jgi:hypothetical protein